MVRRDSRQADNSRPTGMRVQNRLTGRRGAVVANPAGTVTQAEFFVLWDDDSSTSGLAPRYLSRENLVGLGD